MKTENQHKKAVQELQEKIFELEKKNTNKETIIKKLLVANEEKRKELSILKNKQGNSIIIKKPSWSRLNFLR